MTCTSLGVKHLAGETGTLLGFTQRMADRLWNCNEGGGVPDARLLQSTTVPVHVRRAGRKSALVSVVMVHICQVRSPSELLLQVASYNEKEQ